MGVIAGVGMAIAGAEMNGIFRNPASPFTSGISAGAGLGAASRELIVMGAGDETAKSLGVNVERTRICGVVLASFIAAVIIYFTERLDLQVWLLRISLVCASVDIIDLHSRLRHSLGLLFWLRQILSQEKSYRRRLSRWGSLHPLWDVFCSFIS